MRFRVRNIVLISEYPDKYRGFLNMLQTYGATQIKNVAVSHLVISCEFITYLSFGEKEFIVKFEENQIRCHRCLIHIN